MKVTDEMLKAALDAYEANRLFSSRQTGRTSPNGMKAAIEAAFVAAPPSSWVEQLARDFEQAAAECRIKAWTDLAEGYARCAFELRVRARGEP